uniref:CSON011768 protein n=1 Tax=Culicoides sonorensis TaxID=179676 RepID=A0A336LJA2_CULSO
MRYFLIAACYIDAIEEPFDPNKEYSQWNELPDLLLEEIFSYLTVQERYYASLVCSRWRDIFYLPGVWKNFIVKDKTLTRQKYNYYSGWQNVLDHLKTQQCLCRVGKYIKGLTLRPEYCFNNLFQFMSLLSWCIEQNDHIQETQDYAGIGLKIKTFDYIFPCNMAYSDDPESIKLFGTGGSMLVSLKRLMSNIRCLKVLKLTDLMLERYEAKHLLDEVLETNAMNLKILHLINVTNTHCPIMHVGVFLNLQTLVITPQNIDDDILQLIADGNLRHLCLYQNRYSPAGDGISACSAKAWESVKKGNPNLKVHLSIDSDSPDAEIYKN